MRAVHSCNSWFLHESVSPVVCFSKEVVFLHKLDISKSEFFKNSNGFEKWGYLFSSTHSGCNDKNFVKPVDG